MSRHVFDDDLEPFEVRPLRDRVPPARAYVPSGPFVVMGGLQLVEGASRPVVPVGWEVAPLRSDGLGCLWLAWDPDSVRVVRVIGPAGAGLHAVLGNAGYLRVTALPDGALWAAPPWASNH